MASLNSENYLSHIGQTLYLLDTKYAAEKKAYTQFFTQLTFKPDYNREIYKYAYKSNEPVDKFLRGSDYDFMKNKYFYVADVIIGPADKYYETGKMINLKLIETTTKDTIFYRADVLPSWKSKDFITVGYYEKLKKSYMNDAEFVTMYEDAKAQVDLENEVQYIKDKIHTNDTSFNLLNALDTLQKHISEYTHKRKLA